MNKEDEIERLLLKIREQIEELTLVQSIEELTAEELVVLAVEMVTGLPVTSIEMGQPIATVDRNHVWFITNEEDGDAILVSGENHDE